MNYYIFELGGQEKIYSSFETNETDIEILEWAERFGFINFEDIDKCENARRLSEKEVESKNRELYKNWYKEKLKNNTISSIPPTIGDVILN